MNRRTSLKTIAAGLVYFVPGVALARQTQATWSFRLEGFCLHRRTKGFCACLGCMPEVDAFFRRFLSGDLSGVARPDLRESMTIHLEQADGSAWAEPYRLIHPDEHKFELTDKLPYRLGETIESICRMEYDELVMMWSELHAVRVVYTSEVPQSG